ncbi:hypothetical protein L1857_19580 [Amycolatopsis thermalba]|uniref:Uncharacterized protein n=1 Tax=Amycolatopsis thermalba TaxID=944492 RepID=A0ABY4NXP7_9PSEU|nr:hypothetical protein L1857_19580 [Amycolatopsis thermalba]
MSVNSASSFGMCHRARPPASEAGLSTQMCGIVTVSPPRTTTVTISSR